MRQRRNVTTHATLDAPRDPAHVPKLDPSREWHLTTILWWLDIWASPMSGQWNSADEHELQRIARLVDAYARTEAVDLMLRIASEIRLQGERFGFAPLSRSKLRWTVRAGASSPHQEKAEPQPPADPRRQFGAQNGGRSFQELCSS
jgi:hypothetical protein